MKVFTDRMTRGATKALLVNGILLFVIGFWLFAVSLDYVLHPWDTAAWRTFSAMGGWAAAIVVGATIITLSALRLKKSFEASAAIGLSRMFTNLFSTEALFLFVTFMLGLGEIEIVRRILVFCIALNLFLLGLFGGNSRRNAP